MIVARTVSDMLDAIPTDRTVAQVGFNPKESGGFHAGHVACIQRAKSLAQFVTVTFLDLGICRQLFFDDPPLPVPFEGLFGPFSMPFDETYCLNWCETNGVDAVLLSGGNVLFELMNGRPGSYFRSWVDNAITTEGYDLTKLSEISALYFKCGLITGKLFYDQNYWPKNYIIGSWIDGYFRFLMKHFFQKHYGITHDLIDPVARPDGIYYASSTNFDTILNTNERTTLTRIPQRVALISNTNLISNPTQSRTLIIQGFASVNLSPTTVILDDIKITSNIIMGQDALITCLLTLKASALRTRDMLYHVTILRKGIVTNVKP
jgi:hypothetical protein